MTQTSYIRYFETSLANFEVISEIHCGPKSRIRMRPSKQGDAIRIEGPLSEKERIDAIVAKYDEA